MGPFGATGPLFRHPGHPGHPVLNLTSLDSPGVGEEAVEDPRAPVLRRQHHRLLQVVVLLLRVSGPTHDPGLHEGGPRVRQQGLNAALVHLKPAGQQERVNSGSNTATWWPAGGVRILTVQTRPMRARYGSSSTRAVLLNSLKKKYISSLTLREDGMMAAPAN